MFSPLRISIAKWLAPEEFAKHEQCDRFFEKVQVDYNDMFECWASAKLALVAISKLRTPHPNATVRRMADIADKALQGERT